MRIALERVPALFVLVAMSCSAEPDDPGGNDGPVNSGGKSGSGAGSGGESGANGSGGSGPGGSGPGGSGPGGSGPGGSGGSGGIGAVGGTAGEAGTSGATGSAGDAGSAGTAGAAGTGNPGAGCTPAPMGAVTDYGARGPFAVQQVNSTGPSSQYTMFRPRDLNAGFKYPPVTWGNGLSTTPALYVELLSTVASHGFVVIASNSTGITAAQVRSGLEWLIAQNDAAGDFQGKLAVDCAGAIGYSMGGGAATTASAHPAVKALVSMHGLQGSSSPNPVPMLLMTSTDDTFVTKSGFVAPTYQRAMASQPAIMATLQCPGAPGCAGHLLPLGNAGSDRAPLVAWLRYWVYGDQGAKGFFFGSDCTLCKAPWTDIQRKNHMW